MQGLVIRYYSSFKRIVKSGEQGYCCHQNGVQSIMDILIKDHEGGFIEGVL